VAAFADSLPHHLYGLSTHPRDRLYNLGIRRGEVVPEI
jgi:hypothetical protein